MRHDLISHDATFLAPLEIEFFGTAGASFCIIIGIVDANPLSTYKHGTGLI